MKRTSGGIGIVLASALTLAVTGCGAVTGPDEPDPAVVLTSAADTIDAESVRFEMTMGEVMTMTGATDPAASAGEMTVSLGDDGMNLQMEIIFIEDELWMDLGELGAMAGAETPWMRLDTGRLGPDGLLGFQPGDTDPAGAARMLRNLGEVERVDDHTFTGVIDLTDTSAAMVDEDLAEVLGEDAARLPFTATVDDQDRLTELHIDLPASPDVPMDTIDLRLFDYGSPVEVSAPPADQVSELPPELYDMVAQQ